MQLDKSIYETFATLPIENKKITVVQFVDADPVTTFAEFTGTVRSSTTDSVTFLNNMALRSINAGEVVFDNIIPMLMLTFDNQHTYLWRNHTGDADGPLSVSSPVRGGKSKRTRRKTRRLPRKKRVA
jgi:hypothetical protein